MMVIKMKDFQYYIFDFDGTLVDSSEGIYNSIIYALKEFGIEENDREKLRYFIGPPLFHSFKHIYGVNDEDANWLITKYRERYKLKGCEESVVYEGVPEMLKALKEKGKKIAIASSIHYRNFPLRNGIVFFTTGHTNHQSVICKNRFRQ